MFAVVVFTEEDSPAVVPVSWLGDGVCQYPPGRVLATALARKNVLPKDNWITFPVRVLGVFNTYEKAEQKCRLAEDTSDLTSATEEIQDEHISKRKVFERRPYSPCIEVAKKKRVNKKGKLPYPKPITDSLTVNVGRTQIEHLDALDSDEEVSSSSDIIVNIISPEDDNNKKRTETDDTDETQAEHLFGRVEEAPGTLRSEAVKRTPKDHFDMNKLISEVIKVREQVKEGNRAVMTRIAHFESNMEALINQRTSLPSTSPPPSALSLSNILELIPVSSLEQFNELENLLQNHEIFNQLTKRLASSGGSTFRSFLTQVLKNLFDDKFAEKISLTGRSGKLPFNTTRCHRLLNGLCRQRFETETNLLYGEAVGNWFAQAKFRIKKKSGTNMVQVVVEDEDSTFE